MLSRYDKPTELRDLYVYLVLIFICYQSLEILELKYDYKWLKESYIESELLQNEINSEIVKRIILNEILEERDN